MVDKTRQLIWIVIVASVFWLALSPPAMAAEAETSQGKTILVQFEAHATDAERMAIISSMGGELIDWLPALNTAQIQLASSAGRNGTHQPLSSFEQDSRVHSIEEDAPVYASPMVSEPLATQGTIPPQPVPDSPVEINDPGFNNSQFTYAPQSMQVPMAWNYAMGDPAVTIAVLDSGVFAGHPDLSGRIRSDGYDFVNDDQDTNDDNGHGTHVAGIIAAVANNGTGTAGICPKCTILPVKVLDENNAGSWFDVAAGMVYAVDKGAQIINLSLGGSSLASVVEEALAYAFAHDVLVIAAAGNSRSDAPFYPAAHDSVVSVSATTDSGELWRLSNFGDHIDVSAPGYAVFSTYHDLGNHYQGYTFMSGTSMAAPHVAGVAGLLLSQDSTRTRADLHRLITTTAVDLGEMGRDEKFGHGRLDAFRALQAEVPQVIADRRLSGIVWHDSNGNDVWDSGEEAPVNAVTVQVHDRNMVQVTSLEVNASGEWTVDNLLPGIYEVRVATPQHLSQTSSSALQVDLRPVQHVDNLAFPLQPLSDGQVEQTQIFLPAVRSSG